MPFAIEILIKREKRCTFIFISPAWRSAVPLTTQPTDNPFLTRKDHAVNRIAYSIISLCAVVCAFTSSEKAYSQTIFNEFFDEPLDPQTWQIAPLEGTQTLENGQLVFENTTFGHNLWGTNFIVSMEKWPRSSGGVGLRIQMDITKAIGHFWMFGFVPDFVPADDYIIWNTDLEYWFHGIHDGRFFYDSFSGSNSTSDIPFPIDAPEFYTIRTTVDLVEGALWEYNLNDGNGWQLGRDTLGLGGDESPEYGIGIEFNGTGITAVSPNCPPEDLVFDYDFAGTQLDTQAWTLVNNSAGGEFEHNEALILTNPNGKVDWDEFYVEGLEEIPRVMGAGTAEDPLRGAQIVFDVNFTENSNGLQLYMMGIAPASEAFTSWQDVGTYAFHNGNNVWPVQDGILLDTNQFEAAWGYLERLTLGVDRGARWEYSLDDGLTWIEVDDTRGVAGGSDTSFKAFFMYNQQADGGCGDCFVQLNNLSVCYPENTEAEIIPGGIMGIDNVLVGYGELTGPVNMIDRHWVVYD